MLNYQTPPSQTKYTNDTAIKQTSYPKGEGDRGVESGSKPDGFTYRGGGDGPQTGARTLNGN